MSLNLVTVPATPRLYVSRYLCARSPYVWYDF